MLRNIWRGKCGKLWKYYNIGSGATAMSQELHKGELKEQKADICQVNLMIFLQKNLNN